MIPNNKGTSLANSYICTFLWQLDLYNKLGIKNKNIHLFGRRFRYGNNFKKNIICNHPNPKKRGSKTGEQISNDISKKLVYDSDIIELLKKLLKEIETDQPIIFYYDGHGPTDNEETAGNMFGSQLTDARFYDLFKETGKLSNNKMIIFSQCDSGGFLDRIIKKQDLEGYYVAGTETWNSCGLGATLSRAFTYNFNKDSKINEDFSIEVPFSYNQKQYTKFKKVFINPLKKDDNMTLQTYMNIK